MRGLSVLVGLAVGLCLGGCFDVQSADLFLLTRQGPQGRLSMLVSDGGTIRCNGGPERALSNSLLIAGRDLADDLDTDAKARLHLPVPPGSLTTYSVRLPDGTVSFADRNADRRPELGRAVLFALQAAQGPCRGVA